MDSMRSLNTSLPRASPARTEEPLMQIFKDAAFHVTKLYKAAQDDQVQCRARGYQEALEELLSLMDKEDIGLSDGEGWRIRQWATERLDGHDMLALQEEEEDDSKLERSTSPAVERIPCQQPIIAPPAEIEVSLDTNRVSVITTAPPSGDFSFRAAQQLPHDSDMDSSDGDRARRSSSPINMQHAALHIPTPMSLHTAKPSRRSGGKQSSTARHSSRQGGTLGKSAGSKRKINFGEFFDIGTFNQHHRDNSGGPGGGGKRTRFV